MSLELWNVIHTRDDAFEALQLISERYGRPLFLDSGEGLVKRGCERPVDKRRQIYTMVFCDILIDLLVASFGIDGMELRAPTRCRRDVARVRQIGMYVAHTSFGMAMQEVAAGFARDRTTVMYACHLVEDLRDDVDFDAIVSSFERIANSALSTWRMAA